APPPATSGGRSSSRRAVCSPYVAPGFVCEVVSARRQPVEFFFQLLAGVFKGAAVGFGRNKDRAACADADAAEGQVDGGATPVIEFDTTAPCPCHQIDGKSGNLR